MFLQLSAVIFIFVDYVSRAQLARIDISVSAPLPPTGTAIIINGIRYGVVEKIEMIFANGWPSVLYRIYVLKDRDIL